VSITSLHNTITYRAYKNDGFSALTVSSEFTYKSQHAGWPPTTTAAQQTHVILPVMGKSESQLGFKSRFERFGGMIRQILGLIRHERFGFDSIRHFLRFEAWDLTAES